LPGQEVVSKEKQAWDQAKKRDHFKIRSKPKKTTQHPSIQKSYKNQYFFKKMMNF